MSDNIQKVEAKIKELQENLQAKNNYLVQLTNAIQKFKADHKTVASEIQVLSGGLQAFQESLKLMTCVDKADA
jgi:chromosome segregation ATPase